jgi:hypothetical protein
VLFFGASFLVLLIIFEAIVITLPSTFVQHLDKNIPGYDREIMQIAVAQMLWMTLEPRRQHKYYRGAASFRVDEIKSLYGDIKTFKNINRDPLARYFWVYRWNNGAGKIGSYTNGYEPTPWMRDALENYLASPGSAHILNAQGKRIYKLPNAIRSLDQHGNPVIGWKRDDAPSSVKINVGNLRRAEEYCRLRLSVSRLGVLTEKWKRQVEEPLQRNIRIAQALCALANNVTFPECIVHQYVQSASGRLYASGLNLQTCPKELKQAALAGHWDYDISSCHFSIIHQMAERFGYVCSAIRHYVENKRTIRQMIADELGITVSQAKNVLTMTAYGASASVRLDDAIPQEIGVDKARLLYKNSFYKDLREDLRRAVTVVLKNQNSKRYVNAFDKAFPESDLKKKESVIAHLVQGVEAKALRAAIRACKGTVVLLQHDGFTTTERVSVPAIESAVFSETGYVLKFEETQLAYPFSAFETERWVGDLKPNNEKKPLIFKGLLHDYAGSGTTIEDERQQGDRGAWFQSEGAIPPVYPDPLPQVPDIFHADGEAHTKSNKSITVSCPYSERK